MLPDLSRSPAQSVMLCPYKLARACPGPPLTLTAAHTTKYFSSELCTMAVHFQTQPHAISSRLPRIPSPHRTVLGTSGCQAQDQLHLTIENRSCQTQ